MLHIAYYAKGQAGRQTNSMALDTSVIGPRLGPVKDGAN